MALKIMHLIPDLRIGGAERMAITLANGLAQAGHKVVLVAIRCGGPLEAELRTDLGIEFKILQVERASIKRPWAFLRSVRAIRSQLDRLIREFEPDVVQSHIPENDLFVAGSVRRTKIGLHIPVVHSINFHVNRQRFGLRGRARLWILSRVLRHAPAVWAVSNAVAKSVALHTGRSIDSITVLHNGIELRQFADLPTRNAARATLCLPKRTQIVLGVGRLHSIKNYKLLIDASVAILKQRPNTLFLLAGEGDHRAELEARISALGVEKNWRLLGQRKDIALCLAAADVFVQPSRCEGFGLAVIEAMAAGLPVVATDVGGMGEIIEHEVTGLLIPHNDRAQLATSMHRLLAEPELAAQLGQAGKLYAWKNHGLHAYVDQVTTELQSALESKAHPDPAKSLDHHMTRLPRNLGLAFLFGAMVGAVDSAVLIWREAGVRLNHPPLELAQVLLAYGGLAMIFALMLAPILRQSRTRWIAPVAGTLVAGMAAAIWTHTRILQDMPMFGRESLAGNLYMALGLAAIFASLMALRHGRRALLVAGLVIAVSAILPFSRWVSKQPAPGPVATTDLPNITFLLIDTLRADNLGAYGHQRADGKAVSPVIDAFAAQGTRFEWTYAAAPWTRPSVASLFSGLYPSSHGVYEPTGALPEWTVNIAEVLSDRGYLTAGFSANGNISSVWGFGQGFQNFTCIDDNELIAMVTLGETYVRIRRLLKIIPRRKDNSRVLNDLAIPYLRKVAKTDRPLFLYMHYLDPHFPYEPEQDLLNDQPPIFDDVLSDVRFRRRAITPYPFGDLPLPPPEALQEFRLLYDAEIAYVDREIARLMDELRALGRFGGPNDWLIITSDHGEEFFEHLKWGHGQNLQQEVIRVPLIVLGPNVPAGVSIETPVALVDLLPTLADLVGGTDKMKQGIRSLDDDGNPTGLSHPGRSLLPLLTQGDDPDDLAAMRDLYAEKLRKPESLALRRGRYKIVEVENREIQIPLSDNAGASQALRYRTFYDLHDTPYEARGFLTLDMLDHQVLPAARNHFMLLPESLDDAYGDLLARLQAQRSEAERAGYESASKPLSSAEIRNLIQLGYLSAEEGAELNQRLDGD
jgi:arylsulfatase A-like enzyme/glycosyltransferase involved in cell wall biosynthesis